MPRAAAGSAIIRASWPPPTTATTGATATGASYDARDSPGLTRRSVGKPRNRSSGGACLGRVDGAQDVGRARRIQLETESVPSHRGDQARAARVVAELAADPAQVHVDRLRR